MADKKIAKLNIEHYRRLIAKETDEKRLQELRRLLADEESKLNSPPTSHRHAG